MERWRSEWLEIEGRIVGLQTTLSAIQTVSKISEYDFKGICVSSVRPAVLAILADLDDLGRRYGEALGPRASAALARQLAKVRASHDTMSWESAVSRAVLLVGLRAEISACLADPEVVARRRVERAMEHLQRSIAVDDGYRKRWKTAYEKGEVHCEALGGVHLLLHGIWAFKAYSRDDRADSPVLGDRAIGKPDKRVDLVTQDLLIIDRRVESAESLVLTEWKLAKARDKVAERAREGMRQAVSYSGSSLAATELGSVRYVIVVTSHREEMPADDETERPITYRFLNLAVDPQRPSRNARRRT
jgi:hypothetical protein